MSERARLVGIVGLIVATGCGSGSTSESSATGGGTSSSSSSGSGGGSACPPEDSAQLFVDGSEVLPLNIIGGGGTGSPPTETQGDEASLILSNVSASGEEREAFVYLRGLVVGTGISLAQSSIEYRVYPPSDGGPQTPTTDVLYSGASLTGTLDVGQIATQPGDILCGSFDLTGEGEPQVRITGGFHHVLAAPSPGG